MLTQAVGGTPRPWVSQDSIANPYFAVDLDQPANRYLRNSDATRANGSSISVSPNSEFLFFVTTRGELGSDTDRCDLHVFRVDAIREALARADRPSSQPLAAFRQIRRESDSSLITAIEQAVWDSEGRGVLFLALTDNGAQEIHRLDVQTGELRVLTRGDYRRPRRIDWFVPTRDGVVYQDFTPGEVPRPRYPLEMVQRQPHGGIGRGAEIKIQRAKRVRYRIQPSGVVTALADAPQAPRPSAIPGGTLPAGLSVRVVESANDPPRVIASDGQHEIQLWDEKLPQQKIALAHTEPFEWQETDGQSISGGLTLPRGYEKGRPIPLVIQASKYLPGSFLPDGPDRTSGIGQTLAARGFAVLQIDAPFDPETTPIGDGKVLVKRIDAAVEALARAGIVDPTRVALNSAHEAAGQTYFTLTHPLNVRPGAAVAADYFAIATFANYLVEAGANGPEVGKALERAMGGSFWENKETWLELEPSFNADRIQAPFLFSGHGGQSELAKRDAYYVLDLIGAFLLNNKPIDYLYVPRGDAQLRRPLERLALMDVTMDWISFWLQGYEDPSPHKAKQYPRWRPMREQQKQALLSSASSQ